MRIKGFFYILVFLLLALGSVLLFLSSQLNTIFFYIGEGLILFILIYLTFFYRKIVKPLNTIGSGMELLREQDFSSRLSPVGQYEADRVVNIFNRMMEQLKNERLRLREQNNFLDLLIKASPMGVIITSLDEDLSELNPMALKMLGVRLEDVQGKKMKEIDSPLAVELANLPKGEKVTVRLNDSNIYRCTHSSFIDRGFQHPFYLVETLTDEVMKAEKKAYEKVIRMIAHEVNNDCRHYFHTGYGRTSPFQRRRNGRHLRRDACMYRPLFLDESFHHPFCRCGENPRTDTLFCQSE